jgi:hypothetical protein
MTADDPDDADGQLGARVREWEAAAAAAAARGAAVRAAALAEGIADGTFKGAAQPDADAADAPADNGSGPRSGSNEPVWADGTPEPVAASVSANASVFAAQTIDYGNGTVHVIL